VLKNLSIEELSNFEKSIARDVSLPCVCRRACQSYRYLAKAAHRQPELAAETGAVERLIIHFPWTTALMDGGGTTVAAVVPAPVAQQGGNAMTQKGSTIPGLTLAALMRERMKTPEGKAEVRQLGEQIAAKVLDGVMAELEKAMQLSGEDSPVLRGMLKAHRQRRRRH
jgi:hypothetical protein